MKWTFHVIWRYLLGICLLSLYSIAFAQIPPTLSAATQQLIDASIAIKAGKRLSVDELAALNKTAQVRQQMLSDEFTRSNTPVRQIISKQVRDYLPKETQQYVEKEVGPLTGKLEIRAESFEGEHPHEVIQYLLIVGDKTYHLHFTDQAPSNLETDAILTINLATKMVDKDKQHHLILSKKSIVNVHNPKYALPLSLGPQRTLTFIVNFSDKPNDRPWTSAQINTLVYTTISNQYMESSYGQTSVVGRVAGWYVLNVTSTSACNTITDRVSALGDQAATADGIDLSQYDRKVYIFPKTSQCSWAGLGNVGGAKTRAWINGAVSDLRTTAHELGHNLGLYHSRLLTCSGSPNTGTCNSTEYGDGVDIMGAARTSHFNAFQKDRLGWLNYQVSPPITTVTTSGTYTIDAFETKNQNPKALRTLKRAGGTDYYYLEFRQGIGFDAELASCGTSCDYTRGVVFHQGNINSGNSSDLLDMTPSTSSRLVAMLPGQSWTDPAAPNGGVTFEVVSVSSAGAVVKVTFGTTPPPPPPPPPTDIKLDNNVPVSNLSGTRGDEKYYYVEVPAGSSSLTVKISGGTGDADLYLRKGERPTTTQWDCRPYTTGNNETCTVNAPQAGRYFVMVRAYANYSGVTLQANY